MASYSIRDPALRKAIERFVEVAFGSQDSLFTPGTKVWSPEVRADLFDRFVLRPDETPGVKFMEKYRKQLSEAPAKPYSLGPSSCTPSS
jgi:hypothetical protein